MSERRTNKLSKHLRQMKFMQRCGAQQVDEDEKTKKLETKEHWVLPETMLQLPEVRRRAVHEHSPCVLLDINYTRFSFNGANPLVERQSTEMRQLLEEARQELSEKREGVSDDEMARRMESLASSIAKKFTKKKKRSKEEKVKTSELGVKDTAKVGKVKDTAKAITKKVKKFLKPKDDPL